MTDDFSAAPKVVKPKKKYKQPQPEQNEEQQIKLIYNNLMWDKRVFRGNTHAALVTLKNVDNTQQIKDTRRNFKPQQEPVEIEDSGNKRANIEIFTDEFVQTLTDKPPRYEYASQTDPLPEKPVVRHRIPQRQNIADVETQIWDNELFDFDYEVEPLLNVLCGRILEVSRMEVLQEEELNVMKNRQQELLLEEKAQRQKIKQMYEQQSKLEMENARKIQAFRKQKDKKIKTHKRLFSRVLAKDFLKHLQDNTMAIVERNGFFRNPLDIKIMNDVPPLFYQNATKISQDQNQLVSEAYQIAEEARVGILKQHAWAKEVERTRRNQIIFKRQQLAREKKERQTMRGEEKYMREFLVQQKIQKEKEEEQRRKAQEAEENGEAQAEEN